MPDPNVPLPDACDVLVIGGGPAGATAAARLAERGHAVVVLEKDRHPRFHIGESLLPANLPLLDALGVHEAVAAIAMPKWGVEFVSPDHAHRSCVRFADAWDKSLPHAYQVRRSEFDEILIRNAERRGARVHEQCRVREVAFEDGPDTGTGAGPRARVEAVDADGRTRRWHARWVVDASGRDAFLASRWRDRRRNPRHESAALYAHFRGAQRHEGREAGDIAIFWFDHGWCWFIPLADGTTSVGAVCWPDWLRRREGPLEAFFDRTLAMAPALAERLRGAVRVSDVHATGNYSYTTARTWGPGWVRIGDAFTFIDPVFSSGVFLAMQGAFEGADAIDTALREPRATARAMRRFDRAMRRGPRAFSWFIYRVTNPTMRDLFMHPRNVLRVKEALLSMLAGDLYRGTPIGPSLVAFKAIYWLGSLARLPRTWAAWRRRRGRLAMARAQATGDGASSMPDGGLR